MTENTHAVERSPLFWAFLGPLSALLSLTLLYLRAPSDFFPLFVAALIGFSCTWIFRFSGLLASLALLGLLPFTLKSDVGLLWTTGALASVALSFVLTYLTQGDAEEKVSAWRQHVSLKDTRLETLEGELLKARQEFGSLEAIQELSRIELLSALAEQTKLKEELTKLQHSKRKLEDEFEDQSFRLDGNKRLIEQLQQESAHLIREKDLLESTLSRLQADLEERKQEAHPQLTCDVEALPATEVEYRVLYGKYKQLKEQFLEKSTLLDQTRKELFLTSEKGALLEKEMAELQMNDQPEIRALSAELETILAKHEEALTEITRLEELLNT